MIRHLIPDETAASVVAIDPARLRAEGIEGLILDLDDTLVCAGAHVPDDPVCAWIAEAQRHLKVVVLSNNHRHHRVAPIAGQLAVPFIHLAFKPFLRGFRRALGLLELPASRVAVVGDQVFTDVLGGRRLGARTILVTPMTPRERKWARRLMRRAEHLVLRRTHAAAFLSPPGTGPTTAAERVPPVADRVQSNDHAI